MVLKCVLSAIRVTLLIRGAGGWLCLIVRLRRKTGNIKGFSGAIFQNTVPHWRGRSIFADERRTVSPTNPHKRGAGATPQPPASTAASFAGKGTAPALTYPDPCQDGLLDYPKGGAAAGCGVGVSRALAIPATPGSTKADARIDRRRRLPSSRGGLACDHRLKPPLDKASVRRSIAFYCPSKGMRRCRTLYSAHQSGMMSGFFASTR